jgi:hypothetical protein
MSSPSRRLPVAIAALLLLALAGATSGSAKTLAAAGRFGGANSLDLLSVLTISQVRVENLTPSSAVVKWTTSRPATSRVQYGTGSSYGLWTSEDATLRITHAVSVTGLDQATAYHFRVSSHETGSSPVTGADATFTTTYASVARFTSVGANRAILLDGRPFFPVLQWLQCPSLFDKNIWLGVNTFMGKGCQSNTDQNEVTQLGLKRVFSVLPFNASIASSPAMLGWRFPDEPDRTGISPATIKGEYDRNRSQDPFHLNFLTVTANFFSKQNPTGDKTKYRQYAAATDVIGYDYYPIYGWCRPDRISWVADATRELATIYAPTKPVYAWIEAPSTSSKWCTGRGVYDYEVRAEVWMAIVNGAKGIGYFTHSWTPSYSQFRVSSAVQAEMTRTDRQIKTLAPALLATPKSISDQELTAGRINVLATTRNGAVYLFAVNLDRTTTQVRFSGSGVNGKSVRVFEENRTLSAGSLGFVDTFAPLAVHIYVIPPPGV